MPITRQDELLAQTGKREKLELKLKERKAVEKKLRHELQGYREMEEELKEVLEDTKSSGCAGKVLIVAFGAWLIWGGGQTAA